MRGLVLETRQDIGDNISFTGNMFGCKKDVVSHRNYNKFSNQVHDRDVFGRVRINHRYCIHIVTHKQYTRVSQTSRP